MLIQIFITDFSDLSLLRLPADVEEIISNLSIHNSDSEELIFQFEQDFQSRSKAQSEQCVYWCDVLMSTFSSVLPSVQP